MSHASTTASLSRAPWSTGVYDCFDDVPVCLWVLCCTPCAFGRLIHEVHTGKDEACSGECVGCCLLYGLLAATSVHPGITRARAILRAEGRTDMREKFGLEASPCCEGLIKTSCCQSFRRCEARMARCTHKTCCPSGCKGCYPNPFVTLHGRERWSETDDCRDLCLVICCDCCALCQEVR
eukprot:c12908_g1_i1.p1 GENE.c12908_g1_i1~~c12908_g1_i1.p1  ORF type:complete len:180 (+),score=8.30 c12908_g1_i1:35-574(+)